MNISIIGTGYVGLVTGTCFAEMGRSVLCVDIDPQKVQRLSDGELTIYEPGLEVLFERNRREERLAFTTDLEKAVMHGELLFLALPTPPKEDGSADLSYVLNVAKEVAALIRKHQIEYRIVINKSTVPVGTADLVKQAFVVEGCGKQVDVVSNPEFLREGAAVDDFLRPDRVVIGTRSARAEAKMRELYAPFVRNGNPIHVMDERSSEMTKYAANAFLATKITFMNEIANLCERVGGANVDYVRAGIGTDHRIGKAFLYAGIGYGGSCFPKDVSALKKTAESYGYPFQILEAVLNVNDRQRHLLAERVTAHFGGSLQGKRIAVWGLAFKANTDDVRESPAHVVVRDVLASGAEVQAFDPEAIETTREVFGDEITYALNLYEALKNADALLICTEWNEFRQPDLERMKTLMRQPVVFDGRNLYNPTEMQNAGFTYFSIGR